MKIMAGNERGQAARRGSEIYTGIERGGVELYGLKF